MYGMGGGGNGHTCVRAYYVHACVSYERAMRDTPGKPTIIQANQRIVEWEYCPIFEFWVCLSQDMHYELKQSTSSTLHRGENLLALWYALKYELYCIFFQMHSGTVAYYYYMHWKGLKELNLFCSVCWHQQHQTNVQSCRSHLRDSSEKSVNVLANLEDNFRRKECQIFPHMHAHSSFLD